MCAGRDQQSSVEICQRWGRNQPYGSLATIGHQNATQHTQTVGNSHAHRARCGLFGTEFSTLFRWIVDCTVGGGYRNERVRWNLAARHQDQCTQTTGMDVLTHTKHGFIPGTPHSHTLLSRNRDFCQHCVRPAIRGRSGATRASAPCSLLCYSELSQLLSWAKLPTQIQRWKAWLQAKPAPMLPLSRTPHACHAGRPCRKLAFDPLYDPLYDVAAA